MHQRRRAPARGRAVCRSWSAPNPTTRAVSLIHLVPSSYTPSRPAVDLGLALGSHAGGTSCLNPETDYSAIPCSTARHSESSAISVSSVAQTLSCWIISGSTAVFSKSRHRLASPKIWLTSRISILQLDYMLRQVKSCLYTTPADRDEMLSYIGNQHLFLIQEDYNSY